MPSHRLGKSYIGFPIAPIPDKPRIILLQERDTKDIHRDIRSASANVHESKDAHPVRRYYTTNAGDSVPELPTLAWGGNPSRMYVTHTSFGMEYVLPDPRVAVKSGPS